MQYPSEDNREDNNCIEANYFKIVFGERGITSIFDKSTGQDIVRKDSEIAPFTGIYEVTNQHHQPCEERRLMGRNRKMSYTKRYMSELSGIEIVENGQVYLSVQLDYKFRRSKILYSIFKGVQKLSKN